MGRLHRPGRTELVLWLCSAVVLCTAASWPGTLERVYSGSGLATAEPEPEHIRARALVIRQELELELPEQGVVLAEPGEKLAAYSAWAVTSAEPERLALSLEAGRLASEPDRQLALAQARASGSFELMEAALSGYAPPADLSGAEPVFAGVSGLCCAGTDGLEHLGAAEALAMDAAQLRSLLETPAEPEPGLRLVTCLRWYCAVLSGAGLEPGTDVELSLDGETFTARVERSGEGLLLLSGTEGMDRIADIRKAQAEIEVP